MITRTDELTAEDLERLSSVVTRRSGMAFDEGQWLLYFTTAAKRRILARVAGTLRRGGHLFLGHAEGVGPGVDVFRARHLPAGIVHQKI